MKNKKKIICFFLFLTVIFFAVIIFTMRHAIILNLNWNISLPPGYKVLYEKETETNFLGDGIRYHIFQYNRSPQVQNTGDWDEEFKQQETVQELLKKLKVKKENWPDFNNSISYSIIQEDNSKLYMFFDSSRNCIYVLEDIM